MILTELHIYRLKVDLFTHRYGEKSGLMGTGQLALSGSYVWLDQLTPDGWAAFGLFSAEGGGFARELYVKCPVDMADEQVETVLDDEGKPARVHHKTTQ